MVFLKIFFVVLISPDLTGLKYVNNLEDAKEYFYDGLMEELREDTPHGEHGDTETSGQFKFEGKYYELEIEVEYDRHDKRFYYICDDKVKRFEEFTPSVADLGLIEALWNIFWRHYHRARIQSISTLYWRNLWRCNHIRAL